MFISTLRFIPLCISLVLLEVISAFGQAPTFTRVITDQPNYNANFLEGVGLTDGGSLFAGIGMFNTSDPLKPTPAIGLYRFDLQGELVWTKAFTEPDLLSQRYVSGHSGKLVVANDFAYLLAVNNQPAGSSAYPMRLRKIDPVSGDELSIVTLEPDGPLDSLGVPVAFAVIDDAVVLIRDDFERYPRPTTSTVQVFGLTDGELRTSLPKERYFEENPTAWPAAGLVFIPGAEPFGINADGDTLRFPLSIAPSPENGVQPFVALGDRAVYAATQGATGNDVLVTASTDGSNLTTSQVPLPSALAQETAYDLSAWGHDSFAITVRGPYYPLGVFLFDAFGAGGRELTGLEYLLSPHYIDGPKYEVLSEHTNAPPQRRVLAKVFFSGDPVGLMNYVSGDTVALPVPLASPRPEFFDDIRTASQVGPDEILGCQSINNGPDVWVKFDRDGEPLALPQSATRPRFLFNPRLTSLPGTRGVLLHEYYSDWYETMAYLYDDRLVLQDSVQMGSWGESFARTEKHPDGGVVFAIKKTDTIEVRHLTSDCTVLQLATFNSADFVPGGYLVSDLAIGPQGEIALVVVSNSSREPDGTAMAIDANGDLLLGATLVQRSQRTGLAWSPSGSLLIYEGAGGRYQEFKPDPTGLLQFASTGQLSLDSLGITSLIYLSEEEVLYSFIDQASTGVSHASIARYQIPARTSQIIYFEPEESYGFNVELSEDLEILQEIWMASGFNAIVLSKGLISSNRDLQSNKDGDLTASSPFSDEIYFSVKWERPQIDAVEAKLFDTGGRLVFQAFATPLADGEYQLEVPSVLAHGTYILEVNGQAEVCVKQ